MDGFIHIHPRWQAAAGGQNPLKNQSDRPKKSIKAKKITDCSAGLAGGQMSVG